jgi:hypothetical protein
MFLESMSARMEASSSDNGEMRNNMAPVRRHSQTEADMKVATRMARNMGKASSTGPMEVPMKVTSIGTRLRDMVYTDGEMVGYSKENGKLIRWKVWVYSYGLIRRNI